MKSITIESANTKIVPQIKSVDNPTARKISASLPVESKVMTWGDEIYFDTGIAAPAGGATMDVAVGDIAYWPEGKCLCIFFGRTPASGAENKPVPASGVVIVGKADVDPALLRGVKAGARVVVE